MPRVRFVNASTTLSGVAAAGNSESLDLIWFEAMAQFPEEAEALMDKVNRRRGIQKAFASMGRR